MYEDLFNVKFAVTIDSVISRNFFSFQINREDNRSYEKKYNRSYEKGIWTLALSCRNPICILHCHKKAFSLLLLSSLKKIASFRVSCKLYTHILTESFTALQNNVKHFLLCYNMVCLNEFWPEPFNLKRVANIAVKLSNRCNPKSVLNEIDF